MADGKSDWQATATSENLQRRARLLAALRQFFADRDILEVETPVLGQCTVSDVHLQSFHIPNAYSTEREMYLQTSPEYAMKRLLASGSGSIYQITKAFRQEEQTPQHNPEFTLLEWYRVGFTMEQLMDEVEELIQVFLGEAPIPRFTYQQLFEQHLGFNPHTISFEQLVEIAESSLEVSGDGLSDTDYLQLLMNHKIEPTLPPQCFVFDYPKKQAALAKIDQNADGIAVGKRFELYCQGMEIANGYAELTDASEQQARFEQDNAIRASLGKPRIDPDNRLLDALRQGLPECAGVALGVDRLAMVLNHSADISEVISFPFDRA